MFVNICVVFKTIVNKLKRVERLKGIMGHQCITNLNDEIETLKKWIKRVAQGEKYMKSVKIYKK